MYKFIQIEIEKFNFNSGVHKVRSGFRLPLHKRSVDSCADALVSKNMKNIESET